ncbi:MAG: hypothetical protein LIO86_10760 [Lachnospiraceae bacterium]|nr:hypothetical protein [Lachnospiraceae bacterium]
MMGRLQKKRGTTYLGVIALLFILSFALTMIVNAADLAVSGSLTYSYIGVSATNGSSSQGSVSISDDVVTLSASSTSSSSGCSTNYTQYTTTATFTNNYGGYIIISYTNSSGTLTAGTDCTVGSSTITVQSGGTFTFAVTSDSSSTSAVTATLSISDVEQESLTFYTTFGTAINGSYTVDGSTALIGGTDDGQESGYEYVLSAEPDDGYEFYRWVNSAGTTLSTSADFTYAVSATTTITPQFKPEGSAEYYVLGASSTWYTFIDDALNAAGSSGTVVLAKSGEMYTSDGSTSVVIGSGQTLLLPYAYGSTDYSSSDDFPYANYTLTASSSANLSSDYEEYLSLTVPTDTTITCSGKIIIGGTIKGNGTFASSTYGAHSNLVLNGALNLEDSSVLSVCGYIYGDGSVNTTGSGAQIYEPFIICDFGGGGKTVGLAAKSASSYGLSPVTDETALTPFMRYTLQNIQTEIMVTAGNSLSAYIDLYVSSEHHQTKSVMISSTTDAMIKLASGASVTCTYDPDTYVSNYSDVGQTSIVIDGGGEFGYLTLDITVSVAFLSLTASIDTSKVVFNIPYNYDITLTNGDYNIGYSMGLLPGATLTVDYDATLNIGSSDSDFRFIVYDGLNDYTTMVASYAVTVDYSTRKYTYTKDDEEQTGSISSVYPTTAQLQDSSFGSSGTANLIVNGMLNIGSGVNFGGVVQTNGASEQGTPTLVMDSSATASCTTQVGGVGSYSFGSTYYFAGATVRTLTAEILDTATGQLVAIEPGLTYYGATGSSVLQDYTYNLYTTSSSTSTYSTYTDALNAMTSGSWWNYEVTVYMVDPDTHEILSSSVMKFASGTDVSDYYTDQMCTSAATVISSSVTELYSDDIVARVEWADGSSTTYYKELDMAVKDAVNEDDAVYLMKDLDDLDTSVPIDAAQNISIHLQGYSIQYSATPFINDGTLTLYLEGSEISNLTGTDTYTGSEAVQNNADGTLSLDLDGGTITVQASEGQGTQLNGITNYGTLSIADSSGGGGVYVYGPDGADGTTVTLTTTLSGTPTVEVTAEISAYTLATEVVYTGVYNTGTITEIVGGTFRSPMYGIYNGSSGALSYAVAGSWGATGAATTVTTNASIGSISGATVQGGYVGLMNNGATVSSISDSSFESLATMIAKNSSVYYCALWNAFGTVGDINNTSLLSDLAMTLTHYYVATDGTEAANTKGNVTNYALGVYNYGLTAADTSASAGYSSYSPTLGTLTNCTVSAQGTKLSESTISGYSGTYTDTVNNDNAKGIYNLGGSIAGISGGSITGNNGIQNQNLVYTATVYNDGATSSTYTTSTATRTVTSEGTIGDITDCSVTANYRYALLNYGQVGTIGGSSSFTTNSKTTAGYAIYNHGGWYNGTTEKTTVTERETYTYTDSDGESQTGYRNTKITRSYDGSTSTATTLDEAASVWTGMNLPTIAGIEDNVTVTVVNNGSSTDYGHALYNGGRIDSIGGGSGTVTIQAYTGDDATATASNYGLQNVGYIGSIGNNVTISATGERAINNSGNRLSGQVETYTYSDDSSSTKSTTDTVSEYSAPATIGSIGAATLSAGTQYGIYNYGWIGDLTGITITTGTGYGISNAGDSNNSYTHNLTYTTAADAPDGYDADNPGYVYEYVRFGSKIGTISGAKISAETSYGIANQGEITGVANSTITSGTTYELYNGDSYQATYTVTQYNLGQIDEVDSSRYITLEERSYIYQDSGPTIGYISGTTISAGGQYGLANYGTLGDVSGTDVSATANAIYNINGHYTSRNTFRYLYGTAKMGTSPYVGETVVAYTKNQPSIDSLTNVTAVTTSSTYALNNTGLIASVEDCTLSATTYGALYNYYDCKVDYALNTGTATGSTPTYVDWVELNDAGTGYTFRLYDYTESYACGVIDAVTDTKINANSSGNNQHGVYNYGEIGEISGSSVTLSLTSNNNSYVLYNGEARMTSKRTVISDITNLENVANNVGDGVYVTQYQYTYTYNDAPTIGTIRDLALDSCSGDGAGYGLVNYGVIETISGGSFTARSYTLNNASGYYTGTRERVRVGYGTSRLTVSSSTYYFSETDVSYTKAKSEIGTINGAEITTTSSAYALQNIGVIGEIKNSTITSYSTYAIYNASQTELSYTNDKDNSYTDAVAQQLTWDGTTYTIPTTDRSYTYAEPVIELIGEGNTITGTGNVVYNSGEITEIAGGGTTTITATSGVALFNYRGTTATSVQVDGTSTYTYNVAHIGTVKGVTITATKYGIQNGEANTTYQGVTIDELGEGLDVTSSGDHGVYLANYSILGSVTGGAYRATTSGKYGFYMNSSTLTEITNDLTTGFYLGYGTNNTYAMNATAKARIAEGYTISTDTYGNLVDDTSAYADYYFIGKFVTVNFYEPDESAASGWTLTKTTDAYVSGDSGTVTPPERMEPTADTGYTIAFEGWNTANDGSGTIYEADENGDLTVTEDVSLYAIYTQTAQAYTVTLSTGDGTIALTDEETAAGWTETESGVYTLVYTVEDEAFTLPTAVTNGSYVFDGWVQTVTDETTGETSETGETSLSVTITPSELAEAGELADLSYAAVYSGAPVTYYLDENAATTGTTLYVDT